MMGGMETLEKKGVKNEEARRRGAVIET